jgi:hypothetical protein
LDAFAFVSRLVLQLKEIKYFYILILKINFKK